MCSCGNMWHAVRACLHAAHHELMGMPGLQGSAAEHLQLVAACRGDLNAAGHPPQNMSNIAATDMPELPSWPVASVPAVVRPHKVAWHQRGALKSAG